jgi:hypothetical protein
MAFMMGDIFDIRDDIPRRHSRTASAPSILMVISGIYFLLDNLINIWFHLAMPALPGPHPQPAGVGHAPVRRRDAHYMLSGQG